MIGIGFGDSPFGDGHDFEVGFRFELGLHALEGGGTGGSWLFGMGGLTQAEGCQREANPEREMDESGE